MKCIRTIKPTLLILMTITVQACGGGGGGSDLPDYSGSWNINVNLVSNTCPRPIPDQFLSISALHNVNQNISGDSLGNEIIDIVLDDGSDTYVGVGQTGANAPADAFSATGTPHELPGFINGLTCIETINFDYDSINLSPDEYGNVYAGYVTRHSSITCSKGTTIKNCDVVYTGSGYGYR